MITVTEAKEIIANTIKPLPATSISLAEAAGYVLSEDINAVIDVPSFNQSAMDGYAIHLEDRHLNLPVKGEIPAGLPAITKLLPKTAVRIFTGAVVPHGTDAIVMQEKVIRLNGEIKVEDDSLQKGTNIRLKGSDIKAGSTALQKGTLLNPAALGFLASVGIEKVNVIPAPKVTIIITGSELVSSGVKPETGQVYESNSFSLHAALQQSRITEIGIHHSEDDLQLLTSELDKALESADLVLLTGGISVGDYDFVLKATEACGVKKLFHKVKQRPGKPLYFGMKNNKVVFGLPGNPSSVLTCFYEYVIPAIALLGGRKNGLKEEKAKLSTDWKKPAGLTHFLKGFAENGCVSILDAQESYRMSSFARANCFIVLPEAETALEKGGEVTIHLIP